MRLKKGCTEREREREREEREREKRVYQTLHFLTCTFLPMISFTNEQYYYQMLIRQQQLISILNINKTQSIQDAPVLADL